MRRTDMREYLRAGLVLAFVASGVLVATADQKEKPRTDATRQFTLGVVQKELRTGLSQADVAERLGSPNIVTREPDGREAWVYDKVSSEVEASSGSVGVGGVGAGGVGGGGGGSLAGVLGLAAGKRSGKVKSSQKTLTVVIRFSAAGTVEGFTWHASRF
jgi:hypothetical protein